MINQRNAPPWFADLKRELDNVKNQAPLDDARGWKKLAEFLSAHVLFILASAAGPYFSHGIGLPVPHPAAPYIATLLCVMTALSVLATKSTVAFWTAHGRFRTRLTPFILTSSLGITAAVSFSWYILRIQPDGTVLPGPESLILFLLIWPSFTGSIWILLTILYYHFGSEHRQRALLALLNKYYPPEEVLHRLAQVANYKQLSGDIDVLQQLGLVIEDKLAANLDDLEVGRLRVDPADVGPTFTKVAEEFLYYDGVSACELRIWLPNSGGDGARAINEDAREFFNTNAQIVRRGAFVCTRVFVVRRDEVKDLKLVLERHAAARIGWAVVMFEELPFELQQRVGNDDMHFGLFDGGKDSRLYAKRAYAQFHLVDRNPHMTLGFRTVSRGGADLEKHVSAYEKLASLAVWMDDIFAKRHAELLQRVQNEITSAQQQVMSEVHLALERNPQARIVSTKDSIARDFEKFQEAIRGGKAPVATAASAEASGRMSAPITEHFAIDEASRRTQDPEPSSNGKIDDPGKLDDQPH